MANPIRILVAEDDFAISLALKTLLQANLPCELRVAKNGADAWQQLQNFPADLVLSDWNMPEKTGKQLLADIRNDPKLKTLPFLMLTARADKESVIQAVKLGVSGYIHKPFNRADLIAKVKNMLAPLLPPAAAPTAVANHPNTETSNGKRDVVKQIVIRLKREEFELPVQSTIADTVKKMIQEEHANTNDIAAVVGRDAVITAKILALANSALYRNSKPYKNLTDAIARIGIPETQKFLRVFSNAEVYQSNHPVFRQILSGCHLHSIACAECCRILAVRMGHTNPDEIYFVGLMHDIGVLLVTRILEDIACVEPIEDSATIYSAVSQLHGEFGGVLLARWDMDTRTQELIRFHEVKAKVMGYGLDMQILHIADQVVNAFGYSLDGSTADLKTVVESEPAKALGIDLTSLEEIGQQLENYVKEIQKILQH